MVKWADRDGWVDRSKPPKGYIVFTEELYAEVLEQLESEIAEHLVQNYVFKEGFIKASIDKYYEKVPEKKEIKSLLVPNSIRKKQLTKAYTKRIPKQRRKQNRLRQFFDIFAHAKNCSTARKF